MPNIPQIKNIDHSHVRCPMCGDPMTLEEHPTQGTLYWECEFCDEMIPDGSYWIS